MLVHSCSSRLPASQYSLLATALALAVGCASDAPSDPSVGAGPSSSTLGGAAGSSNSSTFVAGSMGSTDTTSVGTSGEATSSAGGAASTASTASTEGATTTGATTTVSSGAGGTTGTGGGGGALPSPCQEGSAGAHYVDSEGGNDDADGGTPTTAWQTLARVNAEELQPGDSVCFFAGGTWTGQLAPRGSGSSDAPIVIDQYGSGALPRIDAGGEDLQAVLLVNQQYIEINHLELTNDHGGPGDYRGISVRGRDAGELSHIVISNCLIHDVTGQVNWIGGDSGNDDPPWVTFQTGWDASKRTGGIVFEIESDNGTKTWFNDVLVEGNRIQDTSFGGIIFKQLEGSFGWGVRSSTNDSSFLPHTNIVIRDNFLSQSNTPYGCNTIYVTGSQHVVIEGNVTQDSGTSAIEVYNADDVLIQRNETYRTVRKAGGADFNGIDADRATTNTIIQYNYIHDNGDGILLAQFAFGSSKVRYNLIVNSSRYGINLHSDSAAVNETYNNLFYAEGLGSASLVNTSGNGEHLAASYEISNNIFYTTRAGDAVATGSGVSYANNLYSGLSVASGDADARSGDPLFVGPSAGGDGDAMGPAFDSLGGFKLQMGSPALNAGTELADNGGVDFWATPLYVAAPDIGPYEAP